MQSACLMIVLMLLPRTGDSRTCRVTHMRMHATGTFYKSPTISRCSSRPTTPRTNAFCCKTQGVPDRAEVVPLLPDSCAGILRHRSSSVASVAARPRDEMQRSRRKMYSRSWLSTRGLCANSFRSRTPIVSSGRCLRGVSPPPSCLSGP